MQNPFTPADHDGTIPHRKKEAMRLPSTSRIARICCVGAMLYRGFSSRTSARLIASATASEELQSMSLPHMVRPLVGVSRWRVGIERDGLEGKVQIRQIFWPTSMGIHWQSVIAW